MIRGMSMSIACLPELNKGYRGINAVRKSTEDKRN